MYAVDNDSYLPANFGLQPANMGLVLGWPILIRDYTGNAGRQDFIPEVEEEVIPSLLAPKGIMLCPETQLAADAGSVMRVCYQGTVCCVSDAELDDPNKQGGFELYNTGNTPWGRTVGKRMVKIPGNSILFIEKSLVGRPVGIPSDYNVPDRSYGTGAATWPQWSVYYGHHQGWANFLYADFHVSTLKQETVFDSNWIPQ